jgi:hypothetical protein
MQRDASKVKPTGGWTLAVDFGWRWTIQGAKP